MYCKNCGQKLLGDDKFCKNCGASLSTQVENQQEMVEKSEVKKTEDRNTGRNEYGGLSGWLALVGIGLIVTIISQLWSFFSDIDILTDKSLWETLNAYNKFFGSLVFFEEILCLFFAGAATYLLVLYFKRDHDFPKYYIIFLVINAAYLLLDYLFVSYLSQYVTMEEGLLNESAANLARGVIFGVIWVAYMSVSKRVKATFVN